MNRRNLVRSTEHTQPWRLDISHAVHRRGDVVMFLTWDFLTGEPAMVLMHHRWLHGASDPIPCIIPLSSTVTYAEGFDNDAEAMKRTVTFCFNLNLDPSQKTVLRLLSFIRDYIGDMLSIPPMPDVREVVAEMLVTNIDTGKESYREVRDHA